MENSSSKVPLPGPLPRPDQDPEKPGMIERVSKRLYFECSFAVMIFLLVAGYIYGITFTDIPENNQRVVDTVLGYILGSILTPIIIWAFKNSKMTQDKMKGDTNVSQPYGD